MPSRADSKSRRYLTSEAASSATSRLHLEMSVRMTTQPSTRSPFDNRTRAHMQRERLSVPIEGRVPFQQRRSLQHLVE